MAPPSFLSLVLVHAILLSNTASATHTASAANTISIVFSKTAAANSTDDYQLPVSVGAGSQLVYLTPSTSTDDTFVNSPKTCMPSGGNITTATASCISYHGGVFGPPQSSSWKPGTAEFSWRNDGYGVFADGDRGQDTVVLAGGDLTVKKFDFAVVDACNLTAGFLGLGRNSTILARLVADKVIGSQSYGLHVGIDLSNFSYPIVDPTFGRGSGAVKGVGGGANATAVHSFPGSLTLGGYDRGKIDSRGTLEAPISSDGSLELEVTNVVLLNEWATGGGGVAHDILNITRTVVIDSSTPYIYLPESTARQLSDVLGAQDGEPGVDFFYGGDADKYIGNLTFTLRVPGGGQSIDVVIPPSVLYQPVTTLRDYVAMGDASHDHYLPIKAFQDSSDRPIVLGRSFLKAAYLFVNHDSNTFEISQVAYVAGSHNIIGVTSDPNAGLVLDKSTTGPVPTSSDLPDDDDDRPPIAPIATAVGAGAVMCAFAIAFIVWRRRQSTEQSTLAPIPSSVTVNHYGNERDRNGTAMVTLPPSRGHDEKNPGGPGQNWGVWEKDENGGCYMPHPLSSGGSQYYEMESDHVGMATTPTSAYPPRWAEFPPAHMHPSNASEPRSPGLQGPVPDSRFEMM